MPRPSRITDPRQLAQARRHQHTDYAKAAKTGDEGDLKELLARTERPLLLILDQVTDPHNLGACLRTADAAGAHAVIVPKDHSATLTDTVRHIACGAAEHVPFIQVTNLARTMQQLKDAGVWITGTSDEAVKSIYEADLTGPTALVAGAEGSGMRRLTTENCDFLVRIPMQGNVPCLNVSVATGVCLFEAVRQRLAARA
ncbi:MAG TPA: 23S rRNA (guanosine(2251)-2'-O)-methyltransferase RlmB [Verrucomicrobiales bacterium]|jgi:23S rRNA (guanosine2251-2'-O)-methyltransferase|nr:23S rRNA (guanosine(2251)-2'-O)-methyltransferase RlmB [Verrucomicrobiales bacterium]